ncbi:UNVERIFIED_CONTAM: hypothetical protein Scaly_2985100, partial [Sesamum calycinum]
MPRFQKTDKQPVAVYVQKRNLQPPVKQPLVPESTDRTVQHSVDRTVGEVEQELRAATTEIKEKGKELVVYNPFDALMLADDDAGISDRGPISSPLTYVRDECRHLECPGLNRRDHQVAVKELISESRLQFLGLLETRVSAVNVSRVQTFLPHWSWFTDYAGPVTVVYGANDAISRRGLWQKLVLLANSISDIPWIVGGDFNAVLDMSEVCGASADIHLAMTEFRDCLLDTGLIHLPVQGERFSWHNCSEGDRSLWKRLDRLLVNDV